MYCINFTKMCVRLYSIYIRQNALIFNINILPGRKYSRYFWEVKKNFQENTFQNNRENKKKNSEKLEFYTKLVFDQIDFPVCCYTKKNNLTYFLILLIFTKCSYQHFLDFV